jgi:hypothetical protein
MQPGEAQTTASRSLLVPTTGAAQSDLMIGLGLVIHLRDAEDGRPARCVTNVLDVSLPED